MPETNEMDATFHFIMETFIKRGYAPHYTEIAQRFDVEPDRGKQMLHDLINTGIMPMWLHPGTDLVASFAPFNNLPTHYRISVNGRQKWFGQ